MVFRTPVQERLSDDDAGRLIERYSELVGEYGRGQLDRDLINAKLRNNVSSKVGMIRTTLRKRNR
ncbi:MAG: hypothetical protein M3P49_00315 [Actinomycetota bacterium]|nr:hypothetical protein [Actinomycetota bacterium]